MLFEALNLWFKIDKKKLVVKCLLHAASDILVRFHHYKKQSEIVRKIENRKSRGNALLTTS